MAKMKSHSSKSSGKNSTRGAGQFGGGKGFPVDFGKSKSASPSKSKGNPSTGVSQFR